MCYETLKLRALQAMGDGTDELPPSLSFSCGAAAGAIAATATTPFDVIKTRRQVFDAPSDGAPRLTGSRASPVGTQEMFREIARNEGLGALFAGLGPRLAKVAPSCAIMIASYEMGKAFFRRRAAESGR